MDLADKIISYIMQQLSVVGGDFGWQMGKVSANYENGYMKCNQDSKAHFRKSKIKKDIEKLLEGDIVEANKMIVTNADRIRSMNEKELLMYFGTSVFCHKINVCRSACGGECNCRECIEIWLKEKVE